jgi:hypothetical protein
VGERQPPPDRERPRSERDDEFFRRGWWRPDGAQLGRGAARLEYLHADLSDPTFSFSTVSGNGSAIGRSVDEGRLKVDTVRVGVSYIFNSNGFK